jgi:hypothetical protein
MCPPAISGTREGRGDPGMMVLVVTLTTLAATLAGGLALASQAERQIAAAHRRAVQSGYVVEAALERVVSALESEADWREVPAGFTLGDTVAAAGLETRLVETTGALNGRLATRFPLGPDTPIWRVAAIVRDGALVSVVWVADDPADGDGQAGLDANGRVMVRAEVRSPAGASRVILAHLARWEAVTHRLSWREVW